MEARAHGGGRAMAFTRPQPPAERARAPRSTLPTSLTARRSPPCPREAAQHSATAIDELRDDIEGISREAIEISILAEGGLHYLSHVPTDSFFHRTLANARELARRSEAILSRAVTEGRCRLEAMLALDYTEIRGDAIRDLGRLFDVSRVPPSGFTPPKFHTAYDALVDEALIRVSDEIKARERNYSYSLSVDLNV